MALHLAARTHAFIHGLFRPSDERLTRELYDRTYRAFSRRGLQTQEGREKLRNGLLRDLLDAFDLDVEHRQFGPLYELITGVLEYENLFVLPEVDWTLRQSVTEYWELRDELNEQLALVEKLDATRELLFQSLRVIVGTVYDACPALLERPGGDGVPAPTTLIRSLGQPGAVTETVLSVVADEELKEAGLYLRSFDRLERNLVAASGGNPADSWRLQPRAEDAYQVGHHRSQPAGGRLPLRHAVSPVL